MCHGTSQNANKHNLLCIIWIIIWELKFGDKLSVLVKHQESISVPEYFCIIYAGSFAEMIHLPNFVQMSFKKQNSKMFLETCYKSFNALNGLVARFPDTEQ
jgi:hypothetical protein